MKTSGINSPRFVLICASLLMIASSCEGGGVSAPGDDEIGPREQIRFPGVGPNGIFDASLEADGSSDRIWMSYSEVLPSPAYPDRNPDVVRTRVAYSLDAGRTWVDGGIVNPIEDVALGSPFPGSEGTWHYEVSSLVYDPGANAAERWKLAAHRYLIFRGTRLFEHGWIELRSAGSVAELAAAPPVKLFVGAGYDPVNDTPRQAPTFSPLGGAPVLALNEIPGTARCLVPTEPGLYATNDALYVSLMCREAAPDNNAIVVLKCESPCAVADPAGWEFVGTVLDNADAAALGGDKLSAPDVFAVGADVYLAVSPVSDDPVPDAYNGCRFFRFASLDGAMVAPTPVATVDGTAGTFNGACTYDEGASGAGVIIGEVYDIFGAREFRLYRTGVMF